MTPWHSRFQQRPLSEHSPSPPTRAPPSTSPPPATRPKKPPSRPSPPSSLPDSLLNETPSAPRGRSPSLPLHPLNSTLLTEYISPKTIPLMEAQPSPQDQPLQEEALPTLIQGQEQLLTSQMLIGCSLEDMLRILDRPYRPHLDLGAPLRSSPPSKSQAGSD